MVESGTIATSLKVGFAELSPMETTNIPYIKVQYNMISITDLIIIELYSVCQHTGLALL